jgi:hypothetical protein
MRKIFKLKKKMLFMPTPGKNGYRPYIRVLAVVFLFCSIGNLFGFLRILRKIPTSYITVASKMSYPQNELQAPFINWTKLKFDLNLNKAAVYTPYDLAIGGGEKYLLSVVSVLQNMGYHVDVLKEPQNPCKTERQLLRLALDLGVHLDSQAVTLKSVNVLKGTLDVSCRFIFNQYSTQT